MKTLHFWMQYGPLDPNKGFLGSFAEVIFLCLLCPTMLESLKKVLRTDPEI